jgi:hypothetical protein
MESDPDDLGDYLSVEEILDHTDISPTDLEPLTPYLEDLEASGKAAIQYNNGSDDPTTLIFNTDQSQQSQFSHLLNLNEQNVAQLEG